MKLLSIEPTPSPNTMKLTLDVRVDRGRTYTAAQRANAPGYVQMLLDIPGVKGLFHTADFIALDRFPNADWQAILSKVRESFGEGAGPSSSAGAGEDASYGEIRLYVQTFRKIPMQIRVRTHMEEVREALPERFIRSATEAGLAAPNLIKERKLEDWGIRYGEPKDIAKQVIEEIEASYSDDRLLAMVEEAKKQTGDGEVPAVEWRKMSVQDISHALNNNDWRVRYQAFSQIKPSPETIDLVAGGLSDDNVSIRRLAVVYLGDMKEDSRIMPLLFKALQDPSAAVRRTAGDTLSDLGDPQAIAHMIEALQDKNKLVRWRAARFLYEVGDISAIEALARAASDPEFEVALQARIALERIEGGKEAEGTVWQQMTKDRKKEDADTQ